MEKKELYWMLVWNKLFGYIDIKLIVEINKKSQTSFNSVLFPYILL